MAYGSPRGLRCGRPIRRRRSSRTYLTRSDYDLLVRVVRTAVAAGNLQVGRTNTPPRVICARPCTPRTLRVRSTTTAVNGWRAVVVFTDRAIAVVHTYCRPFTGIIVRTACVARRAVYPWPRAVAYRGLRVT